MIRKLAVVLVLAGAAIGLSAGAAQAHNGDPSGETLEHCSTSPAPCVDTNGWGVSVIRADGTHTENYGPESYTAVMVDNRLFYTFGVAAEPYGEPFFPTFDY